MLLKKLEYLLRGKFLKNWSNLFIATLISSGSSFLCFALLGRKMPVEDYGLYSSIIALSTTASVFINNILASIVANRELALNPCLSRKILNKFLFIRIVSFCIGSFILFLYTRNDKDIDSILYIALLLVLSFECFWDLFEQIAFGLKITKISFVLNIVSSFLWFIIVLLLPSASANVYVVLIIYSLICFAKTLIYGRLDYKETSCYLSSDSDISFKYLFFSSLPYLYNRILGTVSLQIPILILDGYAGLAETAYYSVGEKFATPIIKLTTITVSALFPFITKMFKDNKKKAGNLIIQLIIICLSISSVISLLLCSTSDIWFTQLFGRKYQNAIEAFNYQVWFACIISVDSILSMTLSADFRQKTLSVITTIDVFILLPFLYFGIPYGAKGIALAKLIAAIISLLYHLFLLSKLLTGRIVDFKLLLSFVLFISCMILCVVIKSRWILILIDLLCLLISILINRHSFLEFVLHYLDVNTDKGAQKE